MDRDYSYTFTVAGRGRFPFDMLRYDECYPVDTQSAENISPELGEGVERFREIKLYSNNNPTELRWLSFGWVIKHVSVGP